MGREKKFSREELWDATRELVLEVGYTGFTFSLLAERLDISRAAIYKQFHNKEDLMIDYMVYEMEFSIALLQSIDANKDFEHQLDDLLNKMYSMKDVHQALGLATTIPSTTEHVIQQKQKLGGMHRDLYAPLVKVIDQGKSEGKIAQHRSANMLLGFIFQTIDVPNFERLTPENLIQEMKEFILYGLIGKNIE
ncbi:MAG: TetR/AcrR family transcriptional regulator [Kurthia sp.]|nr:TetR/AcrR family transcriptional regulator [Candidatus Kurthia equi]